MTRFDVVWLNCIWFLSLRESGVDMLLYWSCCYICVGYYDGAVIYMLFWFVSVDTNRFLTTFFTTVFFFLVPGICCRCCYAPPSPSLTPADESIVLWGWIIKLLFMAGCRFFCAELNVGARSRLLFSGEGWTPLLPILPSSRFEARRPPLELVSNG